MSQKERSDHIDLKCEVVAREGVGGARGACGVDDAGVVYQTVKGLVIVKIFNYFVCKIFDTIDVGEIVMEVFEVIIILVFGTVLVDCLHRTEYFAEIPSVDCDHATILWIHYLRCRLRQLFCSLQTQAISGARNQKTT